MRDSAVMIYFLWLVYGLGLAWKPETFLPLLWVVGVLSIFMVLLGMFVESAQSAQEYRMKQLENQHELNLIDHNTQQTIAAEAAASRREKEWRDYQTGRDNGSYFLHGLGAEKK